MKKRIPTAFALVFVSLLSSLTHGASNLTVSSRLSVGTRSGLFAALYSSDEDEPSDQETGLVSTQLFLTPEVTLAVASKRATFQTNYRLSLSNQIIRRDQFSLNIYQTAGMGLNTQISRTSYFTANVSANMGIVDFSTALQRFGADEEVAANLPQEDRVRFVNIFASMGFTKRFRVHSSGSITAMYRGSLPIGYQEEDTLPFSRQHQAGLRLVYNQQLSRRNSLDSTISGALVMNDPGAEFIPIQFIEGWTYSFMENSSLRVYAGIVMAHQKSDNENEASLDENSVRTETATYWLPLGGISLQSVFDLKERKTLSVALDSGLTTYFDNVTASISQRVFFNAGSSISWPTTWSLTANVTLSTLTTAYTENEDQTTPTIDYPTTAAVSVNAGYQITEQMQLQFGVSSSARWSHFWDGGEFRARAFEQFLFTLTLTAQKNLIE